MPAYYKKGKRNRTVKLVPKSLWRNLNEKQKQIVRSAGEAAYKSFGSKFFDTKRALKDEESAALGEAYKYYKTVKRKISKDAYETMDPLVKNRFFENLYSAKRRLKEQLGEVASDWHPPSNEQQARRNFMDRVDHFKSINTTPAKYANISAAQSVFQRAINKGKRDVGESMQYSRQRQLGQLGATPTQIAQIQQILAGNKVIY